MRTPRRNCIVLVAWLAASAGSLQGADPATAPLRFRKIFVPAERVQEWPRDAGVRYVPVTPQEFDRLVAGAEQTGPTARALVRIERARYQAVWAGDELLTGRAVFDVTHHADHPVFLSLAPGNLAISSARWGEASGDQADLGWAADGSPAVVVEQSGTLVLDWTLRGRPEEQGRFEFRCSLPRCLRNEIAIDMPSGSGLSSSQGVLKELPASQGRTTWKLDLGGREQMMLWVSPTGADGAAAPLAALRQSATYKLTDRGLELSMQLRLNAERGLLRRLRLSLDPGLRVVAARDGETPLAWSVIDEPESQGSQVLLELPAADAGGIRVIGLAAISPVVFDRPWKLPAVRADDVFWQEGKTTLLTSSPLRLQQLSLAGCRQLQSGAVASPQPAESLELQCFEPDSAVEVLLSHRQGEPRWSSGTAVDLGGSEALGKSVYRFEIDEGEQFSLEAAVGRHWTIDDLESDPPSDLSDWSFDAAGHTMMLRLAQPLSPSHPLRLIVSARRLQSPLSEDLHLPDLAVLEFPQRAMRRLVNVRASGPYRLRLAGADSIRTLDPDRLAANDAGLFAEAPRGVLFVADEVAAPLKISLDPQLPNFTADVESDAWVDASRLKERHLIRCRTDGGPVERVLVMLSPAQLAPRWSLLDRNRAAARPNGQPAGKADRGAPSEIVARRMPISELQGLIPALPGELWEIALSNPQADPFDIVAERDSAIGDRHAVGLAMLPTAAAARGKVVLHAKYGVVLDVESSGLMPVPIPEHPSPSRDEVQSAFRYDPLPRSWGDKPPQLSVTRRAGVQGTPTTIVLDCTIESRLSPGSRSAHVVKYRVQHDGHAKVAVKLPSGAALDRVEVNGSPLALRSDAGDVEVGLPSRRRLSTLTLFLSDDGLTAAPAACIRCPEVNLRLPLLDAHWKVELPPGFAFFAWNHRLESSSTTDRQGWTVTVMDITGGRPEGLLVLHRGVHEMFRWVAMLVVVSLAWRLTRQRLALLVLLLAAAGIAWLILPELYVPAAAGVALGSLACIVACLVRPVLPKTNEIRGQLAVRTSPALFVVLLATWLAAGPAACGPAPDATASANPLAPVEHKVFVPRTDDPEIEPAYYAVPETLYSELQRREAVAEMRPQGWLLLKAAYRVAMAWEVVQRQLAVSDIKAVIDFRAFGASQHVRIPFGDGLAGPLPDRALLDGAPVDLKWDDRWLTFEVNGSGEHRLELTLRHRAGEPETGFSMEVPPIPSATLEVTSPPESPVIEVPSALGKVQSLTDGHRWLAELGPADRLTLAWRQGESRRDAVAEVDEFLWLKVKPGSVVLDARFRVAVNSGSLRKLRLVADPRLSLLEPKAGGVVAKIDVTPGNPQLIDLALARPVTEQTTLTATFLLADASGVGRLGLPRLETAASRPGRRWLAVSVDPSLEYNQSGTEGLETVAVADFAARWGQAEGPPLHAYRLPAETSAWRLALRPREPQVSAVQVLALGCRRDRIDVQFDAEISTASGASFQHRISAPADLHVDTLRVVADGAERAARWSRGASAEIQVFLSELAAPRQTVSLRGWLPVGATHEVALPAIGIMNADVRSASVRIFRRPDVRAEIRNLPDGPAGTGPVTAAERAQLGRLVRVIDARSAASALLVLSPNEPHVRAKLVTATVRESSGAWRADAVCRLQVDDGVVDELPLLLPAEWSGPLGFDAPAVIASDEPAGDGHRRVIIHPRSEISGQFQMTLRCRLKPVGGGRVRLSAWSLPGVADVEQFVALPKASGNLPPNWSMLGLTTAKLPLELLSAVGSGNFATYRATSADYLAEWKPGTTQSSRPEIVLADLHIEWHADAALRCLAVYTALPRGRTKMALRPAAGTRLLRAWVCGRQAATLHEGDVWKIRLASSTLPQRVAILLQGKLGDAPARPAAIRLVAPDPDGWKIDRTLWTIVGPSGMGPGTPARLPRVNELQMLQYRADAAATLLAAALDQTDEQMPEDLAAWHKSWAPSLSATAAGLRAELQRSPSADGARAAKAVLVRMDRQLQQADERLTADRSAPASSSNDVRDEAPWVSPPTNRVTRATTPGNAKDLALAYTPDGEIRRNQLWAAAAVLGVCTLLVLRWLRRHSAHGTPDIALPTSQVVLHST